MKKFLCILSLLLIFATGNAQSVTPRTGITPNRDNTYRAMTQKYITRVDSLAGDTLKLNLNAFRTVVTIPALTDSINITFPSVANCYLGDEVTISAINTASGIDLRFTGSTTVRTSTALPSRLNIAASKSGNITFYFNGVLWDEKCRSTNP